MRRLPEHLSLAVLSVLSVGVLTAAPVYAHNSSDDATASSTTVKTDDNSVTQGSGSGSTSSSSGSTRVKIAEIEPRHVESARDSVEDTHSHPNVEIQVQKFLSEKREDKKTKSVEDRQKACVAHETELTKRSENYSRNAKRHLEKFNSIYAKVLAFQADKNLDAANFDSLKATADAKKAAAEAAVASLSGSDVTVDCSAADPAVNIATLKTTVGAARTALQDYRAAVKDVIVALESAKSAANSSDSTSTEAN